MDDSYCHNPNLTASLPQLEGTYWCADSQGHINLFLGDRTPLGGLDPLNHPETRFYKPIAIIEDTVRVLRDIKRNTHEWKVEKISSIWYDLYGMPPRRPVLMRWESMTPMELMEAAQWLTGVVSQCEYLKRYELKFP